MPDSLLRGIAILARGERERTATASGRQRERAITYERGISASLIKFARERLCARPANVSAVFLAFSHS